MYHRVDSHRFEGGFTRCCLVRAVPPRCFAAPCTGLPAYISSLVSRAGALLTKTAGAGAVSGTRLQVRHYPSLPSSSPPLLLLLLPLFLLSSSSLLLPPISLPLLLARLLLPCSLPLVHCLPLSCHRLALAVVLLQLLATAGMRLLPPAEQQQIWQVVRATLAADSAGFSSH